MSTTSTSLSREEKSSPLAVSPKQCAKLLSICLSNIHKMMNSGEIESFYAGTKSRRIPMWAIEAYIARRVAAAEKARKEAHG